MNSMIPLVNIVAQYESIKDEMDTAIAEVIESGAFIRGPALDEFEHSFAEFHGGGYALGLGSGTDALHMAVRSFGISEGDEIVTVPNTWISTAFSASYVGARPIFVDIDPETYQMNPSALERVLTDRTRAIIPVHMFGHPAPMDEIMEIARANNLRVIEDVAQAPLAKVSGRLTGTIGDIGCYSFYPSKILGCYGDGGAILTTDIEIAEKVRVLANYGQTHPFNHQKIGWNSRLDTLQAAVLKTKLRYLPQWTHRRRQIAAIYSDFLDAERIKLPREGLGVEAVYHLYVVQVENRDQCVDFLRQKGIMAQVHYPLSIHMQPCYLELGYNQGDFPVSEQLARRSLSLPIYPEMTESEIERVVSALNHFVGSNSPS